MNYIKQILLYQEIANLTGIPVQTSIHSHLAPDGTTTIYRTFCINMPGLLLKTTRTSQGLAPYDKVSYCFSVANQNVLNYAPKIYCNDSVLARAIYKMFNARQTDKLPHPNIKTR